MVKRSLPEGKSDPYRGLKKEEYIQVLDGLKQLPKLLWDYLKSMPEPLPEADLTRLAQQGFIRKIRNLYRLMPAGNTALARTSVSGEPSSLKANEIAFLQSLTFLPSVDKIKLLEDRGFIINEVGQFVLTPRGTVAKAEIFTGELYIHRSRDLLHNLDESESENEGN